MWVFPLRLLLSYKELGCFEGNKPVWQFKKCYKWEWGNVCCQRKKPCKHPDQEKPCKHPGKEKPASMRAKYNSWPLHSAPYVLGTALRASCRLMHSIFTTTLKIYVLFIVSLYGWENRGTKVLSDLTEVGESSSRELQHERVFLEQASLHRLWSPRSSGV